MPYAPAFAAFCHLVLQPHIAPHITYAVELMVRHIGYLLEQWWHRAVLTNTGPCRQSENALNLTGRKLKFTLTYICALLLIILV